MSHSDEPRRRYALGLADVLILIAVTAVALAWLRKPLEYRLTFISDGRIIDNLRPATIVGAAFAATWSVGVLAIRLRPPRPRGRGWRRRPGFVACAAATVGGLIKLAALLLWGASENYRFESWYVPSILGQLIEPAAMGVAGGWLTLWLAGLWRRERTLIDDLGIVIGLSWLVLEALAWAALCLKGGADIHSADKNGVTALHHAVRFRSPIAVRTLIEHGANVNQACRRNGSTPLHRAVTQTGAPGTAGRADAAREIIAILLAEGADPSIANKSGKTPADYVTDNAIKSLLSKR